MLKAKPVIFMQPGPLHLFWATGVYYFWLLKERFDFVLIVSEAYQENTEFAKLAGHEAIRHVEYLPLKGKLLRHFRCSNRFRLLTGIYYPTYLLLHNLSYIENQYLLHWSRKRHPAMPCFYYQNGRMSLKSQDDFAARRAGNIEALIKKVRLIGHNFELAGKVVDTINGLNFILSYKLLPWLVIQETFSPPEKVLMGCLDQEAVRESNNNNNILLAYLDVEIDAYRALGFDNIIRIHHPILDCGLEVMNFLYGSVIETDSILILPSYGYTSSMIVSGWKQPDLVQHIAGKWCEAIEKLLESFTGFALRMKLHPVSYADPVWQEIIQLIRSRFPALTIIDPMQSAERHIVQSKVIVGDVSSALWWAAMYNGKMVLSLDIFGYPAGDELKSYCKYIYYSNNVNDIPLLSEKFEKTFVAANLCEVIV